MGELATRGTAGGELAARIRGGAEAIIQNGDLGVMTAAVASLERLAELGTPSLERPERPADDDRAGELLDRELLVRSYMIDREIDPAVATRPWVTKWNAEHPDREPLNDRTFRAWVQRFEQSGAAGLAPNYKPGQPPSVIPPAAAATFVAQLERGATIAAAYEVTKASHPHAPLPALRSFRTYARRVRPRAA